MITKLCLAKDCLQRYALKIKNSQFHRFLEMYQQARSYYSNVPIQIHLDCEERLVDAAAAAVVRDNSPLNFAYHSTEFMGLVNSLIEIGQSYTAASSNDMNSLLLTGAAVREEAMCLRKKRNGGIRDDIIEILQMRGDILRRCKS